MSATARKGVVLAVSVLVAAALIAFYVVRLTSGPTPFQPAVAQAAGRPSVNLTLQTVAAVSPKLSPNPSWVSYLIREQGVWHRTTVWTLPAHALVHVTLYQFDGNSGLRNPFLSQPIISFALSRISISVACRGTQVAQESSSTIASRHQSKNSLSFA